MSRYYDDNVFHSGMIDEDELLHYGVKGMKWRKRKARSATGQDIISKRISQFGIKRPRFKGDRKTNIEARKGKRSFMDMVRSKNAKKNREKENESKKFNWDVEKVPKVGKTKELTEKQKKKLLKNILQGKHLKKR